MYEYILLCVEVAPEVVPHIDMPKNHKLPLRRVKSIHTYHSRGFGKPHTNFGVLLSMRAIVTSSNFGVKILLVTLMLLHVSPMKMYI